MNLSIRKESRSDDADITLVHDLAFGRENEGISVQKLRKRPGFIPGFSLVALFENQLIGHLLLTPVEIQVQAGFINTLFLYPVSVMPELQEMGTGTSLVNRGLELALAEGFHTVFTRENPAFFARFDFRPAQAWSIPAGSETDLNGIYCKELVPGTLEGWNGILRLPSELTP